MIACSARDTGGVDARPPAPVAQEEGLAGLIGGDGGGSNPVALAFFFRRQDGFAREWVKEGQVLGSGVVEFFHLDPVVLCFPGSRPVSVSEERCESAV